MFCKKLVNKYKIVCQFTRNQPFFQIESPFPIALNMGRRPQKTIFELRKNLISFFEEMGRENPSKF